MSATGCAAASFKSSAHSSWWLQVFHWLVQDRVDYVETTPDVSRLAHARIVLFMGFLLVRDF